MLLLQFGVDERRDEHTVHAQAFEVALDRRVQQIGAGDVCVHHSYPPDARIVEP